MDTFKPILFSTPMVKAILDGTKTQTRRVIKPQPVFDQESGYVFLGEEMIDIHKVGDRVLEYAKAQQGDIFWVRETWAEAGDFILGDLAANSSIIAYRTEEAFALNGNKMDAFALNWDKIKWKPSIFMPRDVCRIFLEVSNVRFERVQDISEEDSKAEGIKQITSTDWEYYKRPDKFVCTNPKESFESLWDSINKDRKDKEGRPLNFAWEDNPYVFAYDFKVIEKPEDFYP